MAAFRRIAVLMGQELGYNRDVLRGVQAYGRHKPRWVFRDAPLVPEVLKPLAEWKPHGIIAHLVEPEAAQRVVDLGVPLVNTTSTIESLETPLVEVDHDAVGQMAGEYFLDRGFRQFGYFGSEWTWSSRRREAGFRRTIEAAGYSVSSCYAEYLPRPSLRVGWKGIDQKAHRWLTGLTLPVAILSSNDIPARELADLCRQLDLRVPERVALLGVDNDTLECHLAYPPLSSIAIPGQRVGYEAAKMLDALMGKGPRPDSPVELAPLYPVNRQSTDVLAIKDADVANALAFIKEHATEQITVESILDEVPVSRRILERKFKAQLNRTVLHEIRRVRVDRAKALLAETSLPMPAIATRTGFSDSRRLAVVFKQVVRMTPTDYRAQYHLAG